MSKTKQWAWDTAEKVSDDIINSYVKGDIDINKAKEKMSNVDNLDLYHSLTPPLKAIIFLCVVAV